MGLLDGKVAIVTGAGNGLGKSHALLLASEGAHVLVNDPGCARDGSGESDVADEVVDLIRTEGGDAAASKVAVGPFEAAAELVQQAVDAFGGVDVLVNNAGILRDRTALKMSEQEWEAVLTVHLSGTFSCLQAAARVMREQGRGGRIINTTSVAGMQGNFGQSNYSAAKAGIYAVTRTAAMELQRYKITVNTISPTAYTRMTADNPGVTESFGDRYGPQHASPLVAFLASDHAAHITGQTLGVEGTHIFAYRMMSTVGVKQYVGDDPWKPSAIRHVIDQVIGH
ncbi:MAG: SDR family NAD(P)-dependent oxidoreductase [Acidobacteria bacterium]|nr:SDR family NAD(P)-dependent oxidoreductase [Acidobacteriota bacterium]